MQIARQRHRTAVDIAVTLTTVLDSLDARIIDLSEQGAQITGAALPRGAKFQIEYMGQTIYAQCIWSEIDRMGVRFPFDLLEGPLHDALTMASPSGDPAGFMSSTMEESGASRYDMPDAGAGVPRRAAATGFGRRTQH